LRFLSLADAHMGSLSSAGPRRAWPL